MNYIDIIISVPLVWFAWKGFGKGLIIELSSLAGLALGIYISVRFAHFTACHLEEHFSINPAYLNLAAFIITFLAVVIMVFVFAKMMEGVMKVVRLSFLNKLAGLAFGMLKIALIISSLMYAINIISGSKSFPGEELRGQSLLYEPIEQIAPAIFPRMKVSCLLNKTDSIADKAGESIFNSRMSEKKKIKENSE